MTSPDAQAPRWGDVWWVRLDPTLGWETRKTRPCVVLTTEVVSARRRTVVVVPLTSSPTAAPPLLIPVRCAGQAAMAVTDQVRAITKERIGEYLDALANEDIAAIEDGLREVLEL